METPGLSYGLFHAIADPIYSWGVVRQVKFPGVNIDIGHIRNLTWAKDTDQNKWIGYSRMRGQYMSALEHAVPERFFNDLAQCNMVEVAKPTVGLPDCPQGISAVKAIGLATAQGQKIYTITRDVYQNNPGIVNTALIAHSVETKTKVQQALGAGLEVTIHQTPIIEGGWKGAGFISIDPQSGAGGYTIEGGSNGGVLEPLLKSLGIALAITASLLPLLLLAALIGLWLIAIIAAMAWFAVFCSINSSSIDDPYKGDLANIAWGIAGFAIGSIFGGPVIGLLIAVISSGVQNHACFWQK